MKVTEARVDIQLGPNRLHVSGQTDEWENEVMTTMTFDLERPDMPLAGRHICMNITRDEVVKLHNVLGAWLVLTEGKETT